MTDERGRSHLASGHAIYRIVHEDNGDVLSAVGGVNDLRRADGGEVAVALVTDDHGFGVGALESRCYGGSASVGGLHVTGIEVVVGKYRAADGTDKNGAILYA